jgi:hypothetical protein
VEVKEKEEARWLTCEDGEDGDDDEQLIEPSLVFVVGSAHGGLLLERGRRAHHGSHGDDVVSESLASLQEMGSLGRDRQPGVFGS